MLASTSSYSSLRSRARDHSVSPSCRAAMHHSTPPRLAADRASSYDSPMLTPSPLRKRSLFPHQVVTEDMSDPDDFFLHSPFKSPADVRRHRSSKPQKGALEDDDGGIFLSSSSAASFFPSSESQPLRTPIKQVHRAPSRPVLSIKHLNIAPHPPDTTTRTGVGTKRKSTAHTNNFTTPLRQRVLTPLTTPLTLASAKANNAAPKGFAFLAPLPAPRFTTRTPHTKAETDVHLKRQTDTMTKLKICDLDDSGDEFGEDSGYADNHDPGHELFVDRAGAQVRSNGEEVIEAVSPGGHITKRRARSRPVSVELLNRVNGRTSPSPSRVDLSFDSPDSMTFPSVTRLLARTRTHSSSSSSEAGSPILRRRITTGPTLIPKPTSLNIPNQNPPKPREPLQRLESAATLFFGPTIEQPKSSRSRTSSITSPATTDTLPVTGSHRPLRSKVTSRHSYAGSSGDNFEWLAASARSKTQRSPDAVRRGQRSQADEDEDMFFGVTSGPQDSSFMFSVTEGTPSPRKQGKNGQELPKKYKPRDSGVSLSDDDMAESGVGYLSAAMLTSSNSVSTIHSDEDRDALVTPGVGPGEGSGWPDAVFVSGFDDVGDKSFTAEGGVDVDSFILRTLAAGSKAAQDGPKKIPGTPVKKTKTSHLAGERPWQSAAAANKIGFGFGSDFGGKGGKKGFGMPRKSLPAAFAGLGKGKKGRVEVGADDTDEEGEENSPSTRKEKGAYSGLGLGKPPVEALPRTRWLMKRSSSGAFSSGSETSIGATGTPTRIQGRDWNLPPPRISTQLSPGTNSLPLSPGRSVSSSSSGSAATLNSPTVTARHLPISGPRPLHHRRSSSIQSPEKQQGRFEREFEEVDEIGSGAFGKVLKVKQKTARNGEAEGEVFAVKKSKRFEGIRHRLRLREEVDILQHLSDAAATSVDSKRRRHPNVLAYIDSWEQDEALFIRTELCELGNFAHFLWEYGRVFPRLEEARVWKIIVDLSNGLRFIHDAGVIHMDLKPANVFVTGEGRFKIGDFGMASIWPRPTNPAGASPALDTFEREGDKVYLAPEVLQGKYGKEADIFSLGMTMLETASNIVVPDQGESWHRLRQEDFGQVDLDGSPELLQLIKSMMRADPVLRLDTHSICAHPIVARARMAMERCYAEAKANRTSVFTASPLAGVTESFLEEILGRPRLDDEAMDLSA